MGAAAAVGPGHDRPWGRWVIGRCPGACSRRPVRRAALGSAHGGPGSRLHSWGFPQFGCVSAQFCRGKGEERGQGSEARFAILLAVSWSTFFFAVPVLSCPCCDVAASSGGSELPTPAPQTGAPLPWAVLGAGCSWASPRERWHPLWASASSALTRGCECDEASAACLRLTRLWGCVCD